MKTSKIPIALLFAIMLVVTGHQLQAVPLNPTFTLMENGFGMLELPNGAVIPFPGMLAPDPGPGGLSSALTFTAHPAEGAQFFVGDVLLFDSGGILSDVFRFNPGTISNGILSQTFVLYSNDFGGLLADTGLPSMFYGNSVSIMEALSGPTIYTPIAGQPGFLANGPTFRIFSTPDAGSSVSLLGIAFVAIVLQGMRTSKSARRGSAGDGKIIRNFIASFR